MQAGVAGGGGGALPAFGSHFERGEQQQRNSEAESEVPAAPSNNITVRLCPYLSAYA
jgi:hypothetical protein